MVETITKHYVVLYQNGGRIFLEKKIQEIENRNTNEITFDENVVGFSFFDQDSIKDENKIFNGEKYNISPIIFFGKRLKKVEAIEYFLKNNPNSDVIFYSSSSYFCLTPFGELRQLDEENLVYDEYVKKYEEKKSKINVKKLH